MRGLLHRSLSSRLYLIIVSGPVVKSANVLFHAPSKSLKSWVGVIAANIPGRPACTDNIFEPVWAS